MSKHEGRALPRPRLKTVRSKLIAQVLPVAALALAMVTLIAVISGSNTAKTSASGEMSTLASSAANHFDYQSASRQNVGQTMAAMMESYRSGSRPEVLSMLQSVARHYPDILGSYVVFEPNAFDGPDAA